MKVDPFKKLPKIKEFWDELKLSMQHLNKKFRNVNRNLKMSIDKKKCNLSCLLFKFIHSEKQKLKFHMFNVASFCLDNLFKPAMQIVPHFQKDSCGNCLRGCLNSFF